jgi:hypothetical protein
MAFMRLTLERMQTDRIYVKFSFVLSFIWVDIIKIAHLCLIIVFYLNSLDVWNKIMCTVKNAYSPFAQISGSQISRD